jgi:hypothetical protein
VVLHPWVEVLISRQRLHDRLAVTVVGIGGVYLLMNLGVTKTIFPVCVGGTRLLRCGRGGRREAGNLTRADGHTRSRLPPSESVPPR